MINFKIIIIRYIFSSKNNYSTIKQNTNYKFFNHKNVLINVACHMSTYLQELK